eukprot:UN01598
MSYWSGWFGGKQPTPPSEKVSTINEVTNSNLLKKDDDLVNSATNNVNTNTNEMVNGETFPEQQDYDLGQSRTTQTYHESLIKTVNTTDLNIVETTQNFQTTTTTTNNNLQSNNNSNNDNAIQVDPPSTPYIDLFASYILVDDVVSVGSVNELENDLNPLFNEVKQALLSTETAGDNVHELPPLLSSSSGSSPSAADCGDGNTNNNIETITTTTSNVKESIQLNPYTSINVDNGAGNGDTSGQADTDDVDQQNQNKSIAFDIVIDNTNNPLVAPIFDVAVVVKHDVKPQDDTTNTNIHNELLQPNNNFINNIIDVEPKNNNTTPPIQPDLDPPPQYDDLDIILGRKPGDTSDSGCDNQRFVLFSNDNNNNSQNLLQTLDFNNQNWFSSRPTDAFLGERIASLKGVPSSQVNNSISNTNIINNNIVDSSNINNSGIISCAA